MEKFKKTSKRPSGDLTKLDRKQLGLSKFSINPFINDMLAGVFVIIIVGAIIIMLIKQIIISI